MRKEYLARKSEGKRYFGCLGTDRRITLKQILEEQNVCEFIQVTHDRAPVACSCKHVKEVLSSIKNRQFLYC
jgi:hypothetical protein